jgi:hypothetical protein
LPSSAFSWGELPAGEWRAGGTIEAEWPLDHALAIGDRATDGETLAELDAKMAFQAVAVDLPRLWELLGSGATN